MTFHHGKTQVGDCAIPLDTLTKLHLAVAMTPRSFAEIVGVGLGAVGDAICDERDKVNEPMRTVLESMDEALAIAAAAREHSCVSGGDGVNALSLLAGRNLAAAWRLVRAQIEADEENVVTLRRVIAGLGAIHAEHGRLQP